MWVYYNENDRQKAAWLRELIKRRLLPAGEVDERSIRDVDVAELHGYGQCHFFAGIGVWAYVLQQAKWPDEHEVWTGSCPCQSFSVAGKRRGFADERHLWPEWFRLIRERKPVTVFGEQVASKDGLAWLDVVSTDMENAQYAIGAVDLCAAGVGAPHIRQRLYFAADRVAQSMYAKRRQECEHGQDGCDGEVQGRQEAHGVVGACSEVCRLEQSTGHGREQRWAESSKWRVECGCGAGRLGVTSCPRLEERESQPTHPQQECTPAE